MHFNLGDRSSNPTFGCTSKGNENGISKGYPLSMFTAARFTIARMWKQLECPLLGEWTENNYSAIKRRKSAICNSMDGTRVHYIK